MELVYDGHILPIIAMLFLLQSVVMHMSFDKRRSSIVEDKKEFKV
jgi:hypothetical protein